MSELLQFVPDLRSYINDIVSVLSVQQNWGLSFIDADDAWKHTQGENVKVAVIDTGWFPHKDLVGNFIEGHDATDNNDFLDHGNGHGCISPTDKVWVKDLGFLDISDLYNSIVPDEIYFDTKDDSHIKTCASSNLFVHSFFPDGTFNESKILAAHKLNYAGDLIKIKTNQQSELSLTPWHPIYVLRRDTIEKIQAENLITGDQILASQPPSDVASQEKIFKTISHIDKQLYKGEMYDLTIDSTKNYIANGLVVSNTHTSGIVLANCGSDTGVMGVAPKSKLIPIKSLNDDGAGSYDYIIKALQIAHDLDVDIINMSLGSPVAPPNETIHNLIKDISSQGKIIVCASGNDGKVELNFPARYDEAVSVAAVDQTGQLAKFSSTGPQLDAAAPGVQIYSTWLDNQYVLLSGTSMACPAISGIIALLISWYKQHPEFNFVINQANITKLLFELGGPTGEHIIKTGVYNIGVPKFTNMIWTK
jgi:subtilisin family serine protease